MPSTLDDPITGAAAAPGPALQARTVTVQSLADALHAGDRPRWSVLRRVLSRFAYVYLGLYFFPFPISALTALFSLPVPLRWVGQGAAMASQWYEQASNAAAVWFGANVLRLPAEAIVIQPTGSGDTMLGYVGAALVLAVAAAVTTAWSLLDRRPSHPRLDGLFRVYIRYALAAILLSYGFAKVPPLQFQPPGPESLVRTYGDSSPMGLLWTFMGFSPAYTMFAGFAEIIPGVLLLLRRTATLGALIGAATMANIVALNFCYDVPVKLYSMHLLLTAVVIALPDTGRLLNVLVLNRTAPGAPLAPRHPSRWLRWSAIGVKACLVAILVPLGAWRSYEAYHQFGGGAPRPPLSGVYTVGSFQIDGEERPPLLTDGSRWRRFMITRRGGAIIQFMGDTREGFAFRHDEQAGACHLTPRGGGEGITLTCRSVEGGLVLEGPFRGASVRAELTRAPDQTFPLTGRGFHWIQELPFNR